MHDRPGAPRDRDKDDSSRSELSRATRDDAGAPTLPIVHEVGVAPTDFVDLSDTGDSALRALIGASNVMATVVRKIQQVAPSSFTVLVQGETGVGKEVVARAIHEQSRRGGPLIPIDCGAIPEPLLESELFGYERGAFSGADRRKEGLFSLASGGTLFLDEIGNLPAGIQPKLLRVLQERKLMAVGATAQRQLDLRVVAASNVPLEQAVESGRFRSDLYYRLAQFTIGVPPLRERSADILLLAHRFRDEASLELRCPVTTITSEAAAILRAHPWPGNVRQLRNVIRQAVLLARGPAIEAHDLVTLLQGGDPAAEPVPEELPPIGGLKEIADAAAAEAERRAIRHALKRSRGNKSRAARDLKVDYKTLHLKMKRYGLGTDEA